MKLKIGLAQNILYQFNILCTGTKTNFTKVQIELQHIHLLNCLWLNVNWFWNEIQQKQNITKWTDVVLIRVIMVVFLCGIKSLLKLHKSTKTP